LCGSVRGVHSNIKALPTKLGNDAWNVRGEIGQGFRDFQGINVHIMFHNWAHSTPMSKISLGPTERHCVTVGRGQTKSTQLYSPTRVDRALTDDDQGRQTKKGCKQQKHAGKLAKSARKLEETNLAFDQDWYFLFFF